MSDSSPDNDYQEWDTPWWDADWRMSHPEYPLAARCAALDLTMPSHRTNLVGVLEQMEGTHS